MKQLLFLLLCICVVSCTDLQEKKDQAKLLNAEIETLNAQYENQAARVNQLQSDLNDYQYEIEEASNTLNAYKAGRTPQYIVQFKLKQSHFSLDLSQHTKDVLNAIEFELPVSKEFYESIGIGTQVVDEFRVGSLLLKGSIGDWHMTVVNKKIR